MLERRSQGDSFEESVARLLGRDGWQISRSSRVDEPDLLLRKEEISYAAEFKISRDGRRSILESLLADAVLRARAFASRQGPSTGALAIVAAPALTESMSSALREYVGDFAPDVAFGLVDARGKFEFHGKGLEGLQAVPPHRPKRAQRAASQATDLFSDLNQWMLKILLGRLLPEDLLHVPRGRIEGASDLARLAKTSLPSAWRFLAALKEAGFVEESEAGLELVRRDELMEAWLAAVRRPHLEMRAALSIPVREPLQVLLPRHAVSVLRSQNRVGDVCGGQSAWLSVRSWCSSSPLCRGARRSHARQARPCACWRARALPRGPAKASVDRGRVQIRRDQERSTRDRRRSVLA
jgi:hypothetical protein